MMDLSEGTRTLETRARRATVAAWLFFALQLLAIPMVSAITLDLVAPSAIIDLFDTLTFLALALSIVLVGMWIHRAHANLHAAGLASLRYSPGWSVGWFFVPVLNLFKPYDAMRELWNASHGAAERFDSPAPAQLPIWWGLWIGGNIANNIAERMQTSAHPDTFMTGTVIAGISALLLAGAAYALIGIMREVTEAQGRGLSVSTVFA